MPWAGFIADFPDDQVEEGGDIVIFGGRNVAVAIGKILTGLGCRVSPPEYSGEEGWEFDFYGEGRRRFWCRVTSFHPAFWVLLEDPAMTRGTRARNAGAFAEVLRRFAQALDEDARFHGLVWKSGEDGPPEPDMVGSAAEREHAAGIRPQPTKFRPVETGRRRKGCLPIGLALWITFSGIVALAMAVRGDYSGFTSPAEGMAVAAATLAVGVVGLCLALFTRTRP